ncbi:MAG: DUF3179 domain-containing protein [Holophagales bacterium]|nr:DUF3179 domain-containing protein [Holophagales bacterium]MYD24027.1 DUF3179 domain-containing protein [Holophagales bacterium]MYI32950.1 DUF3179 domain-containing protein [Holophagales bacterium]
MPTNLLARLPALLAFLALSGSAGLSAQFGEQLTEADDPTLRLGDLPTAEGVAEPAFYDRVRRLMSGKPKARKRAARALARADESVLIPLVDAYFFSPNEARPELRQALEELSGKEFGSRYRDWFEYIGGREDLETPRGYVAWKGELFSRIDPAYRRILSPETTVRLRLREVQWGGVPLDGIPAIDDPESVPADTARFMRDTDTVFGVSLGGEHRAYPVKVLSWHELLNDTVGGQPIALSFCTLCGSGILYLAEDTSGSRILFGTSGLLYRSNKLMFDHATRSLWSNLTGEAVVGERAAEGARLEMLPMTLTRWDAWRQRHPDTTIMRPDPAAAQRSGYRYIEGAADEARAGVEFPVWRRSDALERNERIYALRIRGEAKAYPLGKLREEILIHDTLGGLPIVIIFDSASGAVRAYERGDRRFRIPGIAPVRQLRAEDGTVWRLAEEGLAPAGGGDLLPRVPGHVAFWFGWYAFYPETGVY